MYYFLHFPNCDKTPINVFLIRIISSHLGSGDAGLTEPHHPVLDVALPRVADLPHDALLIVQMGELARALAACSEQGADGEVIPSLKRGDVDLADRQLDLGVLIDVDIGVPEVVNRLGAFSNIHIILNTRHQNLS